MFLLSLASALIWASITSVCLLLMLCPFTPWCFLSIYTLSWKWVEIFLSSSYMQSILLSMTSRRRSAPAPCVTHLLSYFPSCVPISKPLSSWNISLHILYPAGCAGRERRVSWRARRPNSPSWYGKCSEDSALDRAAETQMIRDPTLPCCFFLKQEGYKSMKVGGVCELCNLFFCRDRIKYSTVQITSNHSYDNTKKQLNLER